MNKEKQIKGFSLLEMLITIMLMSILMLLGFNTFNDSVRTQSEKSAASQVAFAIKNARYYAKKNGTVTQIVFENNSNVYHIYADGDDITDNDYFDSNSGILPDGNKIIDNGCNPLMFYIDGTPISSDSPNPSPYMSNCLITVGKTSNSARKVMLHATTGDTTYE